MNKSMASDCLLEVLADKLNLLGFKPSKDDCNWVRLIENFKDELFFDLNVNSDGSIMQHVKLAFTDKLIAKKIKVI